MGTDVAESSEKPFVSAPQSPQLWLSAGLGLGAQGLQNMDSGPRLLGSSALAAPSWGCELRGWAASQGGTVSGGQVDRGKENGSWDALDVNELAFGLMT